MGDLALQLIGERLRSSIPASDFVAKFESDEFIILQNNLANASDAMVLADRLKRLVSHPMLIEGRRLYMTASIGICVPKATEHDFDAILQWAELALHRAKDEGGNSFRLYEPVIDHQTRRRATLATDLKRAIVSDQEIFLVYQPQFDFDTGKITGVEALCRWRASAPRVVAAR